VLLKAKPHKWGEGKVHVFENGKTRCGKTRESTPGKLFQGELAAVTCKGCLNCLESDRRRAEREREWKRRRAEWQAQRDEADRRWSSEHFRKQSTPTSSGTSPRIEARSFRGPTSGSRKPTSGSQSGSRASTTGRSRSRRPSTPGIWSSRSSASAARPSTVARPWRCVSRRSGRFGTALSRG
jgi:hypothetical protein